MVVLSLPLHEVWHQFLHVLFIADEIVVNNKNRSAPARRQQASSSAITC